MFSRLDGVIDPSKDRTKEIFNIDKSILETDKPKTWNVHIDGNMERQLEVDFSVYAMAVTKDLNININDVTVFEFYAGVTLIKQKTAK